MLNHAPSPEGSALPASMTVVEFASKITAPWRKMATRPFPDDCNENVEAETPKMYARNRVLRCVSQAKSVIISDKVQERAKGLLYEPL
jgi:hypothetical protein